MSVHTLRLALGIFFLVAAVFLLGRHWFAPDFAARSNPVQMNIATLFALVFGCVNVTRWYLAWSYRRTRATPVRIPLQRDPSLVPPQPPNPELDFTKETGERGP